jgi:hypothetical protein
MEQAAPGFVAIVLLDVRIRRVNFQAVRKAALALPGVEEGTAWGFPAFRTGGKMFLCFWENLECSRSQKKTTRQEKELTGLLDFTVWRASSDQMISV